MLILEDPNPNSTPYTRPVVGPLGALRQTPPWKCSLSRRSAIGQHGRVGVQDTEKITPNILFPFFHYPNIIPIYYDPKKVVCKFG